MLSEQKSYRNIVKTTSIFGGVQVVQILVSIVRGKLVAVLLGSAGMGINNLLVSAINVLTQVSGLGLSFSAVRDLSQATESGDEQKLGRTLRVGGSWLLITALIGLTITVLGSSALSWISFDSSAYTWSFVALGVAVALTIVNYGNIAILQGMRKLRLVARASLVGAAFGLVVAVPLYWLFGVEGIVPALVVSSFGTCAVSWYYVRKARVASPSIPFRTALKEGGDMIKLGLVSMVAGLLGAITAYLINAFISNYGSISDVGLYGAATSISNQYIGILFTAMAVDYFPRLAAVCNDREKSNQTVNQQGEIVSLIAAPLLILMMCTAPLIIRILLSKEFLVVTDFICWVAFGMFFKAISYALGYMAFAKGDKKIFFWLDGVAGNGLTLVLNVLGYMWFGLIGMAVSFVLVYVVFFGIYTVMTYKRYGFRFDPVYLGIIARLTVATTAAFLVTQFAQGWVVYVLGGVIFVLTSVYSYKELNKRIGIKELITSRFKR